MSVLFTINAYKIHAHDKLKNLKLYKALDFFLKPLLSSRWSKACISYQLFAVTTHILSAPGYGYLINSARIVIEKRSQCKLRLKLANIQPIIIEIMADFFWHKISKAGSLGRFFAGIILMPVVISNDQATP